MYFSLGLVNFEYAVESPEDICRSEHTILEVVDDMLTRDIFNLMSGEEFLEKVKEGYITSYDGSVAGVYVDGYLSNLGLSCGEFRTGSFLVSEDLWKSLCDLFEIEVNWSNR